MEIKEMIQLRNIYDSLERENPKLVLVEGMDGSGKSTLLRTFYTKYINDSIRVFVTYDLISTYNTIDMFKKIKDELEKSLSQRFNLRDLLIEKGECTIESFVNYLKTLSDFRKVVIIIDNAENGNAQFFGSLLYILRSMQGKKLMIVVSYDPFKINEDFRDFILKTSSLPEGNVVRIKITPLTLDESIKLLEDLGYRLPSNIVEKIHNVSKGNIKTTIQIIEDLKRKKEIDESGYWVGGFPDITPPGKAGLRAIFLKIYNELKENTKRTVEAASSVGIEFNFSILEYITGFSEDILVDALDELIKRNIIREKEMNIFEFTDPEFQSILYNEIITSVKKRFLHKKIGEFYENVQKDTIKCAINFYLAGEKIKAEKYLRESIDIFIKTFNFKNALDFIKKLEEIRPLKEDELILKGYSLYRTGRFSEAIDAYSLLENTKNENLKIKMEIGKAYCLISLADYISVENILKNIENLNLDDDSKFHINYIKGFMNLRRNLLDEAMKYYEKALSYALIIQNKEYLANVYKDMGNINYYKNKYDKAYELYNFALKYYMEIGDYGGVARIYNNLANLLLYNNIKDSIEKYLKALTYADLAGDESLIIDLHYNLANLYFTIGKFEDSERELYIANKFAELKKVFETRILIYTFSAEISLFKGDFSQAISYIEKAMEIARKINSEYYIASLNVQKYVIFTIMGVEIKDEEINENIEKLRSIDEDLFLTNDADNLGLIYIYSGKIENAIKILERAYGYGKERLNIDEILSTFFSLSMAYIISGNHDAFMKIYDETMEKLKGQEMNPVEFIILRPLYVYIKNKINEVNSNLKKLMDHNFYFLYTVLNSLYYLVSGDIEYKENAKRMMEKLGISIFSKYLE